MSRTATAGELSTLGLNLREVTPRIKVQNGSGTMIDVTSWCEHCKISRDVDQPVDGCSIDFTRANGSTQSLSPLRTDSTLNVNDVPAYAPLLDLNRVVTVEVATTPEGALPVSGDYKLLFKGTIDVVSFEKSPVSIVCRDLGAPLVDRWIEVEKSYGTGTPGSGVGGRAIQSVMQDILDDAFGVGVYPLYTPVSPGADLNTFQQQRMSVMDALQELAQQIGWDIRFRWDDGTSAFRLTLSQPPRTKTTPDYTFGPSAYHDITELSLDITDIRNVITGSFRDMAGSPPGNRKTVTVSDATSISKYGRRFFLIQEADVSPVDSTSEMTTMLNSALADLKDPKANQKVNMPFHWIADLWDLYRYSPNSVHYDSDQDIAVVELTHEFAANYHRTEVRVRGTPIGQYLTWRGRGAGPIGTPGGAFPPTPTIKPLNTEVTETSWDFEFNASLGSGGGGANLTYVISTKKTSGSITVEDTGNASAFPRALSITRDPRSDKVLDFAVTDAATGITAHATYAVPSYRPEIDNSGNIKRGQPFDDGGYAAVSTTSNGLTAPAGALDSGLRLINRAVNKDADTLDDLADSATRFAAVQANADNTASNTAAAIAGQGPLATLGAISLTIGVCQATNAGATGPPFNQLSVAFSSTGMPVGVTYDVTYDNGVAGGSGSQTGVTTSPRTFTSVTFAASPGKGVITIIAYNSDGHAILTKTRSVTYTT